MRISTLTDGRPSRARVAWLALALRVVAVLVALQLSGALHDLGDALFADWGQVAAGDCDDCPNDSKGECPVGCPNCHCSVQHNIVLREALSLTLVPEASTVPLPLLVPAEKQPPAPFLPGVFRPPRTLA